MSLSELLISTARSRFLIEQININIDMKLERSGTERPWPVLSYCPNTCSNGLINVMKTPGCMRLSSKFQSISSKIPVNNINHYTVSFEIPTPEKGIRK